MADIINLDEHRPHLSGRAHCMACGHDWVAVAPVGDATLICPECGLRKGLFQHFIDHEGERWVCACGCDVFCITREHTYCILCGATQGGFD